MPGVQCQGKSNNGRGKGGLIIMKEDSVTLKSRRSVASHIFVKEPEGSSEKILKYVKCTHLRIIVPSQKK